MPPIPSPGRSADAADDGGGEPAAVYSRRPRADVNVDIRVNRNDGGVVAGVVENVRRLLNYHELTPDYVAACAKGFAEPQNLHEAQRRLNDHRIVVLVGSPESGRHDTAVTLLHQRPGVVLREVRREQGDRLDIAALGIEQRSGWLLDLRGESHLESSFGRALMGERDKLRVRQSYLAVIVDDVLWNTANAGATDLEHVCHPVEADAIVTSRLAALIPPIDARRYLADTRIDRFLDGATPSEAVQWVQAIIDVESRSFQQLTGSDSPEPITATELQQLRIETVLRVRGNWRKELLDWHRAYRESQTRHFVLAAAVLEGCPVGLVFTCSGELAQALGEPRPDNIGLRGAGILELVHDAGASLTHDDRVEFGKPDYADAVLDYFWVDRQHLQTEFMTWLCRLPRHLGSQSTATVTDRIAGYVLRWSARRRSLNLLRLVAGEWAADQQLRPILRHLLTAASLDLTIGKQMRDELLAWAKPEQKSTAVKTMVAQVCAGELAQIHPQAALYRLATLARDSDPELAGAVSDAVAALWHRADLRSSILHQVATWCATTDAARRGAGAAAFLALAALRDDRTGRPELLVALPDPATSSERDPLVAGWQAVLRVRPPKGPVVRALGSWLDTVVANPEFLAPVQEMFARALRPVAQDDAPLRSFVYLTSVLLSWSPSQDTDQESAAAVAVRDAILVHAASTAPELEQLTFPSPAAAPDERPDITPDV